MLEADLVELFGARFEIDTLELRENSVWSGTLKDRTDPQRLVPIVDGIPRFVREPTYADAFGMQWNTFRSTQLDSRTGDASFNDFGKIPSGSPASFTASACLRLAPEPAASPR